jgi:hypothetical protein
VEIPLEVLVKDRNEEFLNAVKQPLDDIRTATQEARNSEGR